MEFFSAVVIAAALSLPQPPLATVIQPPPRLVITSVPLPPARALYRAQTIRHRRPPGARALMISVGALGGFFAGGYIGSKLEPPCRCDDPGLKGFMIGAPIGAIATAIFVAQETR